MLYYTVVNIYLDIIVNTTFLWQYKAKVSTIYISMGIILVMKLRLIIYRLENVQITKQLYFSV